MGCLRGSDAPGTGAAWFRDSAGVTIVHNDPERLGRGCITLGSEAVVRSSNEGALRGPPLFRVRGGTLLSDGRIVILNGGSKQLVCFGADGGFLEAVGREGRGPGEFTDPRWLGHGGKDTVLVWDRALARVSIFDGSRFLRAFAPERVAAMGPSVSIIGRFADGSFLTGPGNMAFFPSPNGVLRLPESYSRYDPTTGTLSHIIDGRSIEWAVGDRGRYTRPFGKEDIAVARDDRLVIGDNGTSTLRIYDLNGRLHRILEWSSAATPVTGEDRSAWVEHTREELPRFPLAAKLDFPEERPRFSAIVTDDLDWIWVKLYRAPWEPHGSWLVFDESGVMQCEVRFPEEIRILEIGAAHVLGTRRDDSGDQYIVKYTIRRN